jgi:hypothetical protein
MSQTPKFDQSLKALENHELTHVSGGLIGPDGDLSQFPRKFWPVIQPGQSFINVKAAVANLVLR